MGSKLMVFGFYGYIFSFSFFFFNCLVGCFSMIVWTPAVLGVFYVCILYFCICTCSAQLSMFHMERRSRNTLIIIIIIIINGCAIFMLSCFCLLRRDLSNLANVVFVIWVYGIFDLSFVDV